MRTYQEILLVGRNLTHEDTETVPVSQQEVKVLIDGFNALIRSPVDRKTLEEDILAGRMTIYGHGVVVLP